MSAAKTTKWKPGQTGNPRGRPKGAGEVAKIRTAIAAQVPALIEKLTALALGGDVGAARLLLERAVAPLRAAEHAQALSLPKGTLTEQAQAVLAEVAAGNLAPGQGAALLGGISTLAKITEVDEIERRLSALEKSNGNAEATT